MGGRRGTGAAALCSLPRPFPGLRPPAVRRGAVGAGAGAAVSGGRRGWLLGATSGAFLPLGWRGLVTQVDRGRRGGRRNMARCPPSCKLGGGSLRRRAQSPFVRRNKERHCVPPPPQLCCAQWRGLGSSLPVVVVIVARVWGRGVARPSKGTEPLPIGSQGRRDGLVRVPLGPRPGEGAPWGLPLQAVRLNCAGLPMASLTCCVVAAGPKVSALHLPVSTRT